MGGCKYAGVTRRTQIGGYKQQIELGGSLMPKFVSTTTNEKGVAFVISGMLLYAVLVHSVALTGA